MAGAPVLPQYRIVDFAEAVASEPVAQQRHPAGLAGKLVPVRTDETWHRLREWTYGQALSERLAAQILRAEGFTEIDPSHPLGGRDGGKDATAVKDGARWIMAVYFPRGQQSFNATAHKFQNDLAGLASNDAQGMAFVTNQELTLAQRGELARAADAPVVLLHLERVTAILDQPAMHGVRQQFLGIPVPGSPGAAEEPASELLEAELRASLEGEFGFLDTRGLPRDLRRGEPRLAIKDAFVPLRVRLPAENETVLALERLSYRGRRILELRLGLGDEYPRTLDEVGRVFNVSRERIRQIESEALRSLSQDLGLVEGMAALRIELDLRTTIEFVRGLHQGVPVTELLGARRLVLLGGPGSGKSTLTRYLTWALAAQHDGLPEGVRERLPFRVSISDFGRALAAAPIALDEFVYERAGRFAPVVRRACIEGRLLLLLDGLDEITDPVLAGRVQDALNRFLCDAAFAEVSVLLTSRIIGYHPVGPLAEMPDVTLTPLASGDIEQFLSTWFGQFNNIDAKANTRAMMRRLQRDRRMTELASNPMLLTVLALLHARDRQLPNERAQLYAAATETLLRSWPLEQRGSKLSYDTVPGWLAPLARNAFVSPPNVGVPEDDVLNILTLSWQSQFGGPEGIARQQTRQLLEAVQDDSGLLSVTGRSPEGTRLWDFLHRSFAEYLVARDMAQAHLRGRCDPIPLAHLEVWREVILMMLGELGRHRAAFVGPLLERLTSMRSTPWESTLRRDLRLALSVLARDVPCDKEHATAIIDRALTLWSNTVVLPLREHLGASLCVLAETRYASLLAQRASTLLIARDQRLQIGLALTAEGRGLMLEPLLERGDGIADEAAVELLVDAENELAICYLRQRLPCLDGEIAVKAAAVIRRHDPPLAISELVRLARSDELDVAQDAARALTQIAEPEAMTAMEDLLDLDDMPLEPILDRMASAATWQRMLKIAQGKDERRFGAFAVLHRMNARKARAVSARFDSQDFEMRMHTMRVLGTYDRNRDKLAVEVLADPDHLARIWAADVLSFHPRFADEARKVLLVAAEEPDEAERLSALHILSGADRRGAVPGLSRLLRESDDRELRLEAVRLLSEDPAAEALDALASALRDADADIVHAAAQELLNNGDERGLMPLVDAILGGRVDFDTGQRTIAHAQIDHGKVSRTLLSKRSLDARRLGARVLTMGAGLPAHRRAVELLDDQDPTVRCAAAWVLAFNGGASGPLALRERLGSLLDDLEQIDGPPIDDLRWRSIADPDQPVRCCADVAYRLLDARPDLLEGVIEQQGPGTRERL